MNTIFDSEILCRVEKDLVQPLPQKVMVGASDIGLGVFAAKSFKKGEQIFRLMGKIIGLQEVLAKGEQSPMPIQIGYETYIDVSSPAKYLNHSCNPNSGFFNDTILVALHDIEQYEEIRFDYSTTMSENLWTMRCHCGSNDCRGVIEDFHFLFEETQRHYLRLGIVQNFIVREVIHGKTTLQLNKRRIGQQFVDPCLTKYKTCHIL